MGTIVGITILAAIIALLSFVIKGFEKIDHDRKHPQAH
jgi:hypothetical protein